MIKPRHARAKTRPTQTTRKVTAGCYGCDTTWAGPGAQGHAAQHFDATAHRTWARVVMVVRYGASPAPRAGVASPPPTRARRRPWKR